MFSGKYIFAQIMEHAPQHILREYVEKHGWTKRSKTFSSWEQFLAMSFGQLSGKDSIRGLVLCLNAHHNKLYHLGFTGRKIARKTLHDANEKRAWEIYKEFAQYLIPKVQELYTKEDCPFDFEIENPVYALDASTIDLCLNLFPWAKFRKAKGAVKIHTLLDLKGNIPTFIIVTDGKVHDVNILDTLPVEIGAFYIMDRGYLDFKRLYTLHRTPAFFVTRAKKNFCWKRRYSNFLSQEEKKLGICCDQTIILTGVNTKVLYPESLRRIKFFHQEKKKYLVFLTNNFSLPAKNIVMMYKQRWQIELFFKWIKQHLEIQKFWGYSPNAVKTQIWIAVSTYLIIALIKKRLKIQKSLYEILQILSPSLFDKTSLSSLLSEDDLQVSEDFLEQPALELL
jgi:hypothetical protein